MFVIHLALPSALIIRVTAGHLAYIVATNEDTGLTGIMDDTLL